MTQNHRFPSNLTRQVGTPAASDYPADVRGQIFMSAMDWFLDRFQVAAWVYVAVTMAFVLWQVICR